MPDPFVHPAEPSAALAVEAIKDEFDFIDDENTAFSHIIDLGRKLPVFPPEWRDEAHKIPGCLAQVWLRSDVQGDRLVFAGGSDAAIVAGLVALALRVYSGRRADEIVATDPGDLTGIATISGLTTNRRNGIAAMMKRIQDLARAAA